MLLFLDLWSKSWVFQNLAPDEVRSIVPGLLDFRRSLNDGAVFGSFSGYASAFILASMFALGFVLYLFVNSSANQRLLHVALAMVLSGAVGNMYDRAFMKADVVRVQDAKLGRTMSVIGRIVDESDDSIRIGDWPEGTHPQVFRRSEVEIRHQGVVRDFIKFVPRFPASFSSLAQREVWPWIFNVADAALVCGVILLLLTSLFERRTESVPPG